MLKVHIVLTIIWVLLIVPTILLWKESILWIAFMSIYAVIAMHALGIIEEMTRKEVKSDSSGNSNGEG